MKIALIGFSFSGKTTTGKILAQRLKLEFIDSDKIIQELYGDISRIFSEYGEEYFRDIEEKIISDIVENKNNFVLATGGGAVISGKTAKLLKENTTTIWLRASLESIINRDSKKDDHPMLAGKDRYRAVKELYTRRIDLYSFADAEVNTDNKTAEKTVDEIVKIINSH